MYPVSIIWTRIQIRSRSLIKREHEFDSFVELQLFFLVCMYQHLYINIWLLTIVKICLSIISKSNASKQQRNGNRSLCSSQLLPQFEFNLLWNNLLTNELAIVNSIHKQKALIFHSIHALIKMVLRKYCGMCDSI